MPRSLITAAGAVVLRQSAHAPQVLVVHRPRYDDWSLPKGKSQPDEYLPVTAVREVAEETGMRIRVTHPLSVTRYTVEQVPKQVHWWSGVLADPRAAPTADQLETDQVAWWPIHRAVAELTQIDDVLVLRRALQTPAVVPLVVVRHAKAMGRKQWQGPDRDRRLTERGRRQAKALVGLFQALGIEELASSSSTRCMDTLKPFSKKSGLPITPVPELSEESAETDPEGVGRAMAGLLPSDTRSRALAVCGHRPVLPAMFDHLGVQPDHVMKPGEVALVYPPGVLTEGQLFHIAPRL